MVAVESRCSSCADGCGSTSNNSSSSSRSIIILSSSNYSSRYNINSSSSSRCSSSSYISNSSNNDISNRNSIDKGKLCLQMCDRVIGLNSTLSMTYSPYRKYSITNTKKVIM